MAPVMAAWHRSRRESLRKDLALYPTDMVELKRGRIEVCLLDLVPVLFSNALWQRGVHSICLTWSSSGMKPTATSKS
jgi:hypothetical protein